MTDYTWVGGSGSFSDPNQWENDTSGNDGDGTPGAGDFVHIGAAGLNTNAGTITGSGTVSAMDISGGVTFESGTITVTNQDIVITDTGMTVGAGSTIDAEKGITALSFSGGTIEVSGGTVESTNDQIGTGNGNGSPVELEITDGGTWQDTGLTLGPTETSTLVLSGGTLSQGASGGSTLDNCTATVSGGSTWTSGVIALGEQVASSLTIEGGSQVTASIELSLGNSSTADIEGAKLSAGEINASNSTVDITGGSTVKLTAASDSNELSITGTSKFTLQGSGTTLAGKGQANIAGGTNTVSGGAHFQDGELLLSGGTLSITGSGTQWSDVNSGVSAAIGDLSTASLKIDDGAKITDAGVVEIGVTQGSVAGNGTVTLSGKNTSWTDKGNLGDGYSGTGTLTVQNGATLDVAGSDKDLDLGLVNGAKGKLVVDAATVSVSGLLGEGYGKDSVTVQGGGSLSTAQMAIGIEKGGDSTATITGSSKLSVSKVLTVGQDGKGTLTIEHDSSATLQNNLDDGDSAQGAVTVESGATLTMKGATHDLFLGTQKSGQGTFTVNQATATIAGEIDGSYGTDTLTVENSATLSVGKNIELGLVQGGDSKATVSGDSHLSVDGGFVIGDHGTGTATIESGAKAKVGQWLQVGLSSGASGTLTIEKAIVTATTGTTVGGSQKSGGGTGHINLDSGADLNAGNTLKVWSHGEIVAQSGASLEVGSSTALADSISVGAGAAIVNTDGIIKGFAEMNLEGNASYTGTGTGNSGDGVLDLDSKLTTSGNSSINLNGGGSIDIGAHITQHAGAVSIGENGNADLNGNAYDAMTWIEGGTLTVQGTGAAGNQAIHFSGTGGVLVVDSGVIMSNTIEGFASGDELDLRGISFGKHTTVEYSNQKLTIKDGTHTEVLELHGSYTQGDFKLASDGHGGTDVTFTTGNADDNHFIHPIPDLYLVG